MRLTLRTLLAYRDRVLKPTEIEDMHARVQQSVLASNLIKRIDALGQRTNLLAPPIEGKGLGADANSIAEYLDDTLSGEKVPELERICLESDVQLAELAQCHQLLSDGLSASVEVPKELRQKIVALADPAARQQALQQRKTRSAMELEAPPKTTMAPASDVLEDVNEKTSAHTSQEKADRHQRSTRFRADPAHVPASSNGKESSTATASVVAQSVASPMIASGGDSIRTRGLDLEGAHLANEVPEYLRGRSRDGWIGPLAIGGLVAVLCLLVWFSVGSWDSVREMLVMKSADPTSTNNANGNQPLADPATSSDVTNGSNKAASGLPADAVNKPLQPATADDDASAVDLRSSDVAAIPGVSLPEATATENSPQPRDGSPRVIPNNSPPIAPNDAAIQWLPTDTDAMQAVILVQSERQLRRLKPADGIGSGQPVFVPPAFRPRLELPGGLVWTVAGVTHLVATKPSGTDAQSPASLPQVDVQLAQAILSATQAGASIELISRAGTASIRLGDVDAQVAIAVNYPAVTFGPVNDPSAHPPTLFVMVLAGAATIDVAGSPMNLTPGQAVTLSGTQIAQSQPTAPPAWVDPANDRPVDLLAAGDLATQLTEDTPVGGKLLELASHRRPEMRALAAQTLALLGSWEWVADPKGSLNNARDRSFWPLVLDRSRQILAAHPDNVEALKAALGNLDGAAATWRLAMWLGISKPQIDGDAAAQLVKSLESDALIERVLAIDQLLRLTGKDLGFQAEEGGRTAAQNWVRELSAGRIPLLDTPR